MWNHRWRGRSRIEDSAVMIDGNVVAEFVWFELKENAAETKLRKYPWESNTSLINGEAIIKWTESEKYIDIRIKKKKEISEMWNKEKLTLV